MVRNNSKQHIIERAYFCAYCGKRLQSWEVSIDHIIPKSKGGSNHFANMTGACKPCNSEKSDKEWILPQFVTTTGIRLTPSQRNQIMKYARRFSSRNLPSVN